MNEFGNNPSGNFASEKEKPLEPTLGQKRAAEIDFFIKRVNIFEKGSKSYINWKRSLSGHTVNESKKSLKDKANTAFEELYKADGKIEDLQEFRSKWGQDAESLENIFDGLRPEIVSSKEQIVNNTAHMGKKDRVMISIRAAKALGKLSSDQKKQILTIAGYSGKEMSDITKKIGISASINLGTFFGYEAAAVAAGGAGAMNPFLGDISSSKAIIAVALAYAAYFSTLGINAQQNLRLLRNESINTSPSAVATGTFFLLKKLLPHNKKWQNWGTRFGSVALEGVEEALWFGTMFIPVVGPSISVSGNLTATVLNGLQALIAEGILRYKKSEEKDI
jgi:hypothetical protein